MLHAEIFRYQGRLKKSPLQPTLIPYLLVSATDSNKYLAKIANKAKVSEKTYRSALEMLSAIKKDPVSHGKDPNALAVAVLYAACLREGENVSQAQIAVSGDISIVTLRKRFQDVRKIFSS